MPSPPGAPARRSRRCRAGRHARTPNGASASTTALWTAGVAPIVPDSPIPFAPSGVHRGRRLHLDRLPRREVGGRGERVADERLGQRVAVLVVDDLLVERLRDAGRDAAVHLALRDQRVDQRAGVVDGDQAAAARRAPSRCRPRRRRGGRRTGMSAARLELVRRRQLGEPVFCRCARRRAPPTRSPASVRPGDVEAAEGPVEHDVVGAGLEVVGDELLRLLDDVVGGEPLRPCRRSASTSIRRFRCPSAISSVSPL